MPNNTINDSDVVGGSRQITIGGQTYETDDFALDFDIMRYVRKNSDGVASGKRVIQGERTGSATLQYPNSTVNAPVFGASFTTVQDGVSITCTIEKVGIKLVNSGEAKIPVTFGVNIGAVVLTSQ